MGNPMGTPKFCTRNTILSPTAPCRPRWHHPGQPSPGRGDRTGAPAAGPQDGGMGSRRLPAAAGGHPRVSSLGHLDGTEQGFPEGHRGVAGAGAARHGQQGCHTVGPCRAQIQPGTARRLSGHPIATQCCLQGSHHAGSACCDCCSTPSACMEHACWR